MRYTEARLTHLGAALMEDMDKDTVDFVPNYDETRDRADRFPGGVSRICSSTAAPASPSAWRRTCRRTIWAKCIDGICAQIDDPDITIDELMEHRQRAGFPDRLRDPAASRASSNISRPAAAACACAARSGVEELKGGREQIIITEIPYNVNRAGWSKRIADLVNEKILTDITAIRDESDENTRVVIELKRDGNPKVVINNLYKHTALESSFTVQHAGDRSRPAEAACRSRTPSPATSSTAAKSSCAARVSSCARPRSARRCSKATSSRWRTSMTSSASSATRRTAKKREGQAAALSMDRAKSRQIGILIRSEARLTDGRYAFTEQQVNHILDLRLYQLTGLERDKIKSEYDELLETIKDLLDILAKRQRVLTIIKDELREIQREVRHAAPDADRAGRRRDQHRRPHRQRRLHHHASRTTASSSAPPSAPTAPSGAAARA